MCGCADVRMCGFADVRMRRCADVPMCGCANVFHTPLRSPFTGDAILSFRKRSYNIWADVAIRRGAMPVCSKEFSK
jgi:hypothetical protein